MLATIVCAFLQGARGYSAIAQWIHCQPPQFWYELGYTRRPPRWGAFRKLMMRLCPAALERALRAWIEQCLGALPSQPELSAVALDGKTLCGTLEPHQRALHLLSVFDQYTGCTLGQTRMDPSTNEAKAALELLRDLVLKGRVVTGDAMFCQREVCQETIDSGGHYLFVVKDNQQTLKEAIAAEFAADFSPGQPQAA